MALQADYQLAHRRGPGPGHSVDASASNGSTRVAQAEVQFGAAVQRISGGCGPLVPGGVFSGIAKAIRLTRDGIGAFAQYENVPVVDAGPWWGVADRAFTAGAALNWNSATLRWTDLAVGGAIVAAPGVEADEQSNGAGHEIHIRMKRTRT